MDDALREAEHGAGHQQRDTPHQVRRAREVGPPRVEREPQTCAEQDDRGGDEPGDLSTELGEKEAIPASEAPARSGGSNPADASGLISREASEPVVAEDQVEQVVVLRAADIRTVGAGPQLDDGHPPSRCDDQSYADEDDLLDALEQTRTAGDKVDHDDDRHDDEGLQHLGKKTGADQRRGQNQPARRAAFGGAQCCVSGGGEEQDQECIRVVVAEHQGRDRRQGHNRARDDAGGGAEPSTHRHIDNRDSGHAFQRLRHEYRPLVEAEKSRRNLHHPEEGGRLVDGDEVGSVEGAEEEGLPALRAGLNSGGVVGVGPAVAVEAPDIQDEGDGHERRE